MTLKRLHWCNSDCAESWTTRMGACFHQGLKLDYGHPHYALCTSLYSVAKTTWFDFRCQKLDDEMLFRSVLKKSRFQRISGDDCWKITKGWKEHCDFYTMMCWMGWFVTQECQLCSRVIFQQINKTFRSKICWAETHAQNKKHDRANTVALVVSLARIWGSEN